MLRTPLGCSGHHHLTRGLASTQAPKTSLSSAAPEPPRCVPLLRATEPAESGSSQHGENFRAAKTCSRNSQTHQPTDRTGPDPSTTTSHGTNCYRQLTAPSPDEPVPRIRRANTRRNPRQISRNVVQVRSQRKCRPANADSTTSSTTTPGPDLHRHLSPISPRRKTVAQPQPCAWS